MVTPDQRHAAVNHLAQKGLSGRAACRWTGVSRHVSSYRLRQPAQDAELLTHMRQVTQQHPRFGYRRVAVMVPASFHRTWRLWKRHDFRLAPARAHRRRRSTGQAERPHRAEYPNQVWTYDFVHDRLATGQTFKTLNVLDEFTRECLAIKVGASLRATEVVAVLSALIRERGKPAFIRSDNGSEFTARRVLHWLQTNAVGPSFIEPGHPWQNGFVESFHSRFRDECLNREWFPSRQEAEVVIEQWRQYYNTQRPHSALGYKTPAQVAAMQPT